MANIGFLSLSWHPLGIGDFMKRSMIGFLIFSFFTFAFADTPKIKRKRRTGLRITEPKEVIGPKSFSCYPGNSKPAEKDEFTFSLVFEDLEKCKVTSDSLLIAGENRTFKTSSDGKLSANCNYGQMVAVSFGKECKFTLSPIETSK